MRVEGSAELLHDDPLLARYPEAQFLVRVRAERIYPNCPRYTHKRELIERSVYVPQPGTVTPVPGWKESDWARDVLLARPGVTSRPSPSAG